MANTTRTVKTAHTSSGNGRKPAFPSVINESRTESRARIIEDFQRRYGKTKNAIQANLNRCSWCSVKKSCDFSFIEPGWLPLWGIHARRDYKPGQYIVHSVEGEPSIRTVNEVLVICEGEVKVHKTGSGGTESLRRIGKPGNMIMDIDFFAGTKDSREWGEGSAGEDVKTISHATVTHIPGDVFDILVDNNRRLNRRKMSQMARAAKFGSRDVHSAMYLDAKQRLARALNLLKDEKRVVNRKLRDIAASAGLSVETTCRLLKIFREQGYVTKVDSKKNLLTEGFFNSSLFSSVRNA